MNQLDVQELSNKYFISDIFSRLYRIALDLADDSNYSREAAVKDIDHVCSLLGESIYKVGDDHDNK